MDVMGGVMAARISNAEAKRLGLTVDKKKRTTRKEAAGPFRSRCWTCEEEFDTQAAETRHVLATRHSRYEVIF